jgi:SAM-dependent methyltransferase
VSDAPRPSPDRLPARLQLGAFDQAVEGWLNTDVTPHLMLARVPGGARLARAFGLLDERRHAQHRAGTFAALRYLDVSRRFPFPDRRFEAIYSSHLLEHLDRDVAEHCLRECRRVLRTGGVLRLAVPDLDRMIAAYDPADPDRWLAGLLQEGAGARHRHRWHYNARSLDALLRRAGFGQVERCEFRRGRCPDLERIEVREGSLFMEAVE